MKLLLPKVGQVWRCVLTILGGQTPIANSLEVFEKVQKELPAFVADLASRGLTMRQVYRAAGNEGKVRESVQSHQGTY